MKSKYFHDPESYIKFLFCFCFKANCAIIIAQQILLLDGHQSALLPLNMLITEQKILHTAWPVMTTFTNLKLLEIYNYCSSVYSQSVSTVLSHPTSKEVNKRKLQEVAAEQHWMMCQTRGKQYEIILGLSFCKFR